MEQFYNIAGLTVQMDSFGRTVTQAQPYLCAPGTADIVITSHPEQLQKNQPHLSLEDCEYLSTGAGFYRQLLDFDGLMLHASAVVMDGYAYLFSAPCGTGKSTHTALWQKVFGKDRAVALIFKEKLSVFINGVSPRHAHKKVTQISVFIKEIHGVGIISARYDAENVTRFSPLIYHFDNFFCYPVRIEI